MSLSVVLAAMCGPGAVAGTIAGMAALERRLFASRPVCPPRPAGTPPQPPPELARGFTWSVVVLVDQLLDREPSEQVDRDFAATIVQGAKRYEQMAAGR